MHDMKESLNKRNMLEDIFLRNKATEFPEHVTNA